MSRWHIESTGFEVREKDYWATFACKNLDTGKSVEITLRQDKGCPASDLVGSCRALAQLLIQVATADDPTHDSNIQTLN